MAEIVDDLKVTLIEITSDSGLNLSGDNPRIKHTGNGCLTIESTSDAAPALKMTSPGGFDMDVDGQININTTSTSDDSIDMTSPGGIDITTSGASKNITLTTTGSGKVDIPGKLEAGYVFQDHQPSGASLLVPTGAVIPFAGSSSPGGWVLCNGGSYSTTTYSTLFTIIGYTYGGSGANFNVPDLRSRLPLGAGAGAGLTARTLAATGGQEAITQVPPHTHNITDLGHSHSYVNNVNNQDTDNAFATQTAADDADVSATTGTSTTGITINNTGTNVAVGAVDVMNPFLVLNYIIKV
jgi:microcystin-dependent protein